MDKARFIEVAPNYYALAIMEYLTENRGEATRSSIISEYRDGNPHSGEELTFHLRNSPIMDRAILWLEKQGFIESTLDDFGPPGLTKADDPFRTWQTLAETPNTAFKNYAGAGRNRAEWLYIALRGVNDTYERLGIQASDFDDPDSDWEPIPLDRNEPLLSKAIEKLDVAINEVGTNNGYAVAVPEERSYVLENLVALRNRLHAADTISRPYLRNGFGHLSTLIKRFGGTALELVVAAATDAIKEWAKKRGLSFLDGL